MRPIDADALKEKIEQCGGEGTIARYCKRVLAECLDNDAPTIDVAPVVHGWWRDTGSGQECSVCKEIQYGYDNGRFYCPNCGAKMDNERRI